MRIVTPSKGNNYQDCIFYPSDTLIAENYEEGIGKFELYVRGHTIIKVIENNDHQIVNTEHTNQNYLIQIGLQDSCIYDDDDVSYDMGIYGIIEESNAFIAEFYSTSTSTSTSTRKTLSYRYNDAIIDFRKYIETVKKDIKKNIPDHLYILKPEEIPI